MIPMADTADIINDITEGMDIMKAAPNHSNRAIYEENHMRRGAAMYTAIALRHLGMSLD